MNITQVKFTQFMRPNGKQVPAVIELQDDDKSLMRQADMIRQSGCRLTCEVLATGEVSFCIEDRDLGDYACEVVENGEAVPNTVRSLIMGFDRKAFTKWQRDQQ
jgi:hypothetical protein